MPTPFYHLAVARQVLMRQDLSPQAAQLLQKYASAFLLGNTAPDVQTVSGQPRQETHFFELPLHPQDRDPWEVMFGAHPSLRRLDRIEPDRAAFIAGYASHLLADWMWVKILFNPVFGQDATWGSPSERVYLHNVLRSYLDFQILPGLIQDLPSQHRMERLQPRGWLPFVQDTHIEQWRDYLCGQLKPGAAMQTVEVFAARQGIPAEQYYRLLNSETLMEREIFSRLPYSSLLDFWQRLLDQNVQLLNHWIASRPRDSAWMPLQWL